MKRLFLSAAALVVLFAACSKDEDNKKPDAATSQPHGKYFLHQISPFDSLEVTYDSAYNMKLVKVWDENGKHLSTSQLVYENGKLTKMIDDDNNGVAKVVQSMEYNSAGKLAKAKFYLSPGNNNMSSYDSLVYDADGHLSELHEFAPDLNGFRLDLKLTFIWDSKGNIIRTVGTNIAAAQLTDTSVTEFTYDDKVNYGSRQPEFFSMRPYDPTFGLSANNVTKKVGGFKGDLNNSTVNFYEYTYDEEGYPLSRKDSTQVIREGQVVSTYHDSFRYRYLVK